MIKEEVTSEDIADVVSRWTGIPVSKMLQSEREAAPSGRGTPQTGHRAGRGHTGRERCRAAQPCGTARPETSHRFVHLLRERPV